MNPNRRAFFREMATSIKKAAAEFVVETSKPVTPVLRPPGSPDEDTFLSLCQKCTSCVEACPCGILEAIEGLNPVTVGTPIMNLDNNYCEKCYTCIDACKSGALSRENLKRYRYIAKINKSRCVAYMDIFCQTCYWSCPNIDRALKLKDVQYPYIDESACEGCGRCVNSCPTIPKSIELVKHEIKNKRTS